MKLKYVILALFAMAVAIGANADDRYNSESVADNGVVTMVNGTDLARLQSAADVLKQIVNVEVTDDNVIVNGRSVAAVYIDKRRVVNLDELWNLPASNVQSVTVNQSPNVMYDRDVQALIVINLIKEMSEGLHIDNNLRMTLNTFLSASNRLNLDYRLKKLEVQSLLVFEQYRERQYKTSFEDDYNVIKDEMVFKSRKKTMTQPNKHLQFVTAGLLLGYKISRDHQVRLGYQAQISLRNKSRVNNGLQQIYVDIPKGDIEHSKPTIEKDQMGRDHSSSHYHNLRAEYDGRIGNVILAAGNNSVWQSTKDYSKTYRPVPKLDGDEDFLRRQLVVRNFLRAKMPLLLGNLHVGGEHKYDYFNVSIKDRTNVTIGRVHGAMDVTTLAGYASVDQKIGAVELEAGLRYEMIDFRYKAMPDDENLQNSMYKRLSFGIRDEFFYPNVAAKLNLGTSKLTLRYVRSNIKPDMANIRVVINDAVNVNNYMLFVERISTTSLDWQYKWLNVRAEYKQHSDPLFHTTDGKVDYTGNCFDGIHMGVDLTPTIGIWSPALSLQLHKQWLYMKFADGSDKACQPMCVVQFNNTLMLPGNWLVRCNAKYHTKGDDHNVFYYKHNFQLDASVMKDFFNKRLTVEASLENMLRDSWDDVTIKSTRKTHVSKGYRHRLPRTFVVSLRYKI